MARTKKAPPTPELEEVLEAPQKSYIATAIEQTEKTMNANTNIELDNADTWGGFKIEVGITPPPRSGGGTEKYDWAAFPAPSNPDDPTTWPSVFIPGVGSNGINKSIRKFREKLQKADPNAFVPEFTLSASKDPKGVRVFRKK